MGKIQKRFEWLKYLFDDDYQVEENISDTDDPATDTTEEKINRSKKKKERKGIDDDDPISFRTATEPLTFQQIVYYIIRDLLYASGPMFSYIGITLLCIIIGYPLSGMMRYSFSEYLADRSNIMIAIGVVLTLRRLHKKSKKNGSTFFEDASLYRTNIQIKKIFMSLFFGAGCALFLSSALTLIPKVWIFGTYNENVNSIYQRYDILLTIIESAVLTPLVEEIIFRGYMLNRLLRRWPDLPALIVTTVIFSCMHGSSIWIMYAFVMGWIIGKISMIEGNILYGIFLHAGFNFPSVIQWFIYLVNPALLKTQRATDVFETIILGLLGLITSVLIYLIYRRSYLEKNF